MIRTADGATQTATVTGADYADVYAKVAAVPEGAQLLWVRPIR